jgi:hypothetical protein
MNLTTSNQTVLIIVGYLVGRQCNSRAYLSLKNAMSQMGFIPRTSHIVSYRSTNTAKSQGDLH